MRTVLLTGFEPFDQDSVNLSWRLRADWMVLKSTNR